MHLRVSLAALLFSSLALTACALDEEPTNDPIADEEAALVETTAAGPSFVLSVQCGCQGAFTHCSGEVHPVPPSLTLKFNGVPVAQNGGFFEFNPGGSGNLVAKGCNASGCTSRSRFIQFLQCPIGGGGPDPAEP